MRPIRSIVHTTFHSMLLFLRCRASMRAASPSAVTGVSEKRWNVGMRECRTRLILPEFVQSIPDGMPHLGSRSKGLVSRKCIEETHRYPVPYLAYAMVSPAPFEATLLRFLRPLSSAELRYRSYLVWCYAGLLGVSSAEPGCPRLRYTCAVNTG